VEAALAAYDSQINLLSGADRKLKRIGMPDTKFYTQGFKTKEALDSYISDPKFGSADKPAVCFGFEMQQHEAQKNYTLELFFNDAIMLDYRSVPD
jgi:hypothetical protein